jgi:hypothetical protein
MSKTARMVLSGVLESNFGEICECAGGLEWKTQNKGRMYFKLIL